MVLEKLVKSSIMDALDLVWSQSGIIPSKKTRRTILEAAEKISLEVEVDFKKARKKQLLNYTSWLAAPQAVASRKTVSSASSVTNESVPIVD